MSHDTEMTFTVSADVRAPLSVDIVQAWPFAQRGECELRPGSDWCAAVVKSGTPWHMAPSHSAQVGCRRGQSIWSKRKKKVDEMDPYGN